MAPENSLSFSFVSGVEDVLQQHSTTRVGDLNMESRKAEEDALRRNEAAGWLRKMVGVVAAKDLPAEPSDEEFRLGLRSGIVLCNAINKVQPGAVPKVVESPPALIPDGTALSAFQYFENVRNFLVAAQELGFPSFEASDLEQGGKTARVVNCILALKSYSEWKQTGGNGVWKFGGNIKTSVPGKSSPFMNSMSRSLSTDLDSSKMSSSGLSMLVRTILLDKKPDEVPTLVESVLNKVVEEFEHRIASQYSLCNGKAASKDATISQGNRFSFKSSSTDKKVSLKEINRNEYSLEKQVCDGQSKAQSLKQQKIFDQQQRDIQDLKHTLHITKAGMQFMQMKFQEECTSLGVHIHSLAHAASGYHKVLEENRKLYNQVQDLKGNIRVYCRVRPLLSGSNYLSTVEHIEDRAISISIPSRHGKGCKSFNFNKVFGPSATQAEVYYDMQPLVRSVLDGYNVCIFAYGQTGSGKTFTMSGPRDLTEKSLGVNYRALSDLFQIAKQRRNIFHYSVAVQMIEIYNEQVRDLLVTDGSNRRLEIRNSSQTGLNVPEANLVPVSSTSDVSDLMNLGHRNRAVGATALNDRSSRSHSCLTVHVQGKDLTSGVILRGCMHLVDLAGSERVDKSEVAGDRLKEAQHINKSLSALGDVIASLAQKNSHVPYRNSKLTQLLQDSLGGQAKTLMFVHISPEPDAIGETISTLKFAERVATVELGAVRVNKDSADVKELKEQIAMLKAALARKESGASLFNSTQQLSEVNDKNIFRQSMGDVCNIEVHSKVARQKHKSFDLDNLLANSPPWPPVISPNQKYGQDEKDLCASEWVDKVMVNKQDAGIVRAENSLQGWETDNDFYQKFFSDSSNIYPEKSYNMLMSNGSFYAGSNDDMDELDAATSDSSEPDLLWQYNQSKRTNIESMIKKPTKAANHPSLSRNLNHTQGPSPSRKLQNTMGIPVHKTRQPVPADGKRKTGNRK